MYELLEGRVGGEPVYLLEDEGRARDCIFDTECLGDLFDEGRLPRPELP